MSADKSNELEVSEREQNILRVLVDHYINDGQPVGSRTLSKMPGVGISAASVRNVMGDLEHMGLLKSPHTSAGRIPTSAAYRMFVDSMLEYQQPTADIVDEIRNALNPSLSEQALIKIATHYLSGVTEMAGMITVPKREHMAVRQIEFLPLSDRRILAILIVNDKEVYNRIIHVEREYTKQELEDFAGFLNTEYLGKPLSEVRDALQRDLQDVREDMGKRMQFMIEVAGQALTDDENEDQSEDLVVSGETNLMSQANFASVDTLRDLFDAFQKKRDMYHLLERCISAEGVQIFIGKEAGYDVLQDFSLVTSTYQVNESIIGVLGVVGPKRMAYDKVIPVVDVTSKLLSAALNSKK